MDETRHLLLNADGACDARGTASFGVVARWHGQRAPHIHLRKDLGPGTNNVGEWRGALAALSYAVAQPCEAVTLLMDSKLVVEQLNRRWKIKAQHLQPLAAEGWRLVGVLRDRGTRVEVRWVPREQNRAADRCAAGRD